MRSATARARDAAQIRKLNQDQLAYVSQRDAGYQQQWSDYRRYHENDGERGYTAAPRSSAQDDYARARSDYAASLAQWRRDVTACRNGDYDRCAN
ncbi:hypothetical protein [Novosphingobium sp. 9]|uniref:hypothetical protein n=1 Tax=Novosphingobium sp. 9 TaxID=2025349 RepID=UPI0021B57576|nr:hypothetical protein [Novosphingobium sp. 9]